MKGKAGAWRWHLSIAMQEGTGRALLVSGKQHLDTSKAISRNTIICSAAQSNNLWVILTLCFSFHIQSITKFWQLYLPDLCLCLPASPKEAQTLYRQVVPGPPFLAQSKFFTEGPRFSKRYIGTFHSSAYPQRKQTLAFYPLPIKTTLWWCFLLTVSLSCH